MKFAEEFRNKCFLKLLSHENILSTIYLLNKPSSFPINPSRL